MYLSSCLLVFHLLAELNIYDITFGPFFYYKKINCKVLIEIVYDLND